MSLFFMYFRLNLLMSKMSEVSSRPRPGNTTTLPGRLLLSASVVSCRTHSHTWAACLQRPTQAVLKKYKTKYVYLSWNMTLKTNHFYIQLYLSVLSANCNQETKQNLLKVCDMSFWPCNAHTKCNQVKETVCKKNENSIVCVRDPTPGCVCMCVCMLACVIKR